MEVASVLESVGVSAYLGAASSITDPAYVTVAGEYDREHVRQSIVVTDSMSPYSQDRS